MKVKALSAFCIGGGTDVVAGQEFETDDYNGRRWIAMGFVVAAPEVAEDEIRTRDPEPTHREPRARRAREE